MAELNQPDAHFLVIIKQHNIALLFNNYLNSQGIISFIKEMANSEGESGFAIYCPEPSMPQAKLYFEQFIQHPDHVRYQAAAWQQGEVSNVKSTGPSLVDTLKTSFIAHAGVVTLTVFALCWITFIASYLGFFGYVSAHFKFYPTLTTAILFSEPYRLITPAFIHFSMLHIVFNTLWWWQLGGEIEAKLGKGSLLHVFLLTALISNLGQFLVAGPNFGGLSGVVYGLFGYVWWLGWLKPDIGLGLPKALIGFLLFWLALGFFDVLPVDMANTAHLLGLITGCLLAFFKAQKNAK